MGQPTQTQQTIAQTPSDFTLLPGETLLDVSEIQERQIIPHRPSTVKEMTRLTGVNSLEEIGQRGPTLAGLTLDADSILDDQPAPEELRLYEALFGRDSLIVSLTLKDIAPKLLHTTILSLARLQGVEYNQKREEEPGRIVHEVRTKDDKHGQEISRNLGWEWPYYGAVDSTPLFVNAIYSYCRGPKDYTDVLSEEYIDRRGHVRNIAHSLSASIAWINRKLDSNPEGLLEYCSVLPNGIQNQVWKDSPDSYHHADGTIANHKQGIASIEVQTMTYDALLNAADLYENELRDRSRAFELREKAKKLKQTILSIFWTEDKGGYFVLGTDRDKNGQLRQMKIRTSNMGHVLDSRLLEGNDPEIVRKREAIVRQLFAPEMQNVSGIRTLASDEKNYRSGSYHNGSVWPWDTFKISQGLRRHHYVNEANILDEKLLNVANSTYMFPEYVRGDDSETPITNKCVIEVKYTAPDGREKINKVEQPPQEVQAFTVAAILAIKAREGAVDRFTQPVTEPTELAAA